MWVEEQAGVLLPVAAHSVSLSGPVVPEFDLAAYAYTEAVPTASHLVLSSGLALREEQSTLEPVQGWLKTHKQSALQEEEEF
jgi:hypothetical protein